MSQVSDPLGYIARSMAMDTGAVDSKLHFGDQNDGFDMVFDGTNTLNIDPVNANDVVRIGENTQADFQVDGLTDLLWDASLGALLNGAMTYVCAPTGVQDTNSTNASNISLTSASTVITSAGAETRTLPDGTSVGQLKHIVFGTDGGTVTLTITSCAAAEDVVTLAEAGQGLTLFWDGALWNYVGMTAGDTVVMDASLPATA